MYYRTFVILILSIFSLAGCNNSDQSHLQGYIEADYTYIAAPFSGKLENLSVTRGQTIQKNAPLFTLEQISEQADLEQARKQLDQATAAAKLAQARFLRTQRLFVKRAIDQDSLDAARADLETKQAEAAALEQQITKARWAVQQKTVTSPVTGIIYDTYYVPGELVSAGTPILSLLAPENLYVTFFLPEALLGQIRIGDMLSVSCDNCDPYQAKINYIAPQAEYTPPVIYSQESNYKLVYKIKAVPQNVQWSLLHPGQPVYVQLNPAKPGN